MISQIAYKSTCVLGCGNTLFGDDGFGPAVIAHLLANHDLPESMLAEDVGTGVRDILFDLLLSPQKPQQLLIVDASTIKTSHAGHLMELAPDQLEPAKGNDYSVHHFPSLNLLSELQQSGEIKVRLLVLAGAQIPEEVCPGLSAMAQAATPRAVRWVMNNMVI